MESPAPSATASHVLPDHLGEKWRDELLKRRALTRIRHKMGYVGMDGETTFAGKKRRAGRRVSRLQRFWLRPANLPDRDAAEIAPLLTPENTGVSVWRNLMTTFTYTFVLWVFSMLALTIWGASFAGSSNVAWVLFVAASLAAPLLWLTWATSATLYLPRRALRNINTDAVTANEIEAFLPTVRGDLDRAYLNTVLQTIRQPLPVSASASVGAALRSVGDAVSALPGDALPVGADDPASLRLSALDKKQRAAHEPDSLVQGSLLRQADAAEKQAQIVENGGTAARRARARHDETVAQLHTLRAVLTTYASGANGAILEQSERFADATEQVAAGAMASAQAKRELDDAELIALYGQPLPEPQAQTVGVATQNTAPSGKWWQ